VKLQDTNEFVAEIREDPGKDNTAADGNCEGERF
jgi:hypothetical protein